MLSPCLSGRRGCVRERVAGLLDGPNANWALEWFLQPVPLWFGGRRLNNKGHPGASTPLVSQIACTEAFEKRRPLQTQE